MMLFGMLKRFVSLTYALYALILIHPPTAHSNSYQLAYVHPSASDQYDVTYSLSHDSKGCDEKHKTRRTSLLNNRQYPMDDYGNFENLSRNTSNGSPNVHQQGVFHPGSANENRIERRKRDRELRDDIRYELETNPFVDEYDVRVLVLQDLVILQGIVEDRDAMVAAVESAYEAGARKVKNRLRIRDLEDTPWTDMSDRELRQEIRDQLSTSPWVDGQGISLKVRDGVATLRGLVDDHSAMVDAIENTYAAGARRVINRLQLRH